MEDDNVLLNSASFDWIINIRPTFCFWKHSSSCKTCHDWWQSKNSKAATQKIQIGELVAATCRFSHAPLLNAQIDSLRSQRWSHTLYGLFERKVLASTACYGFCISSGSAKRSGLCPLAYASQPPRIMNRHVNKSACLSIQFCWLSGVRCKYDEAGTHAQRPR